MYAPLERGCVHSPSIAQVYRTLWFVSAEINSAPSILVSEKCNSQRAQRTFIGASSTAYTAAVNMLSISYPPVSNGKRNTEKPEFFSLYSTTTTRSACLMKAALAKKTYGKYSPSLRFLKFLVGDHVMRSCWILSVMGGAVRRANFGFQDCPLILLRFWKNFIIYTQTLVLSHES